MKSSELINELAKALCNAQGQMGGVVKDSSNPFFKSKYADITSVIKAIKQPFSDNGLSYTQFPISNEHGVGVSTRLMHVSGQYLEMEYTLPTVKKDPQSYGSAITYARRYALQSIAGIPVADDDAEAAMLRGDENKSEVKTISENQIITIEKLLDETKSDRFRFLSWFKVGDIKDILANDYERVVSALEAKK
jgi:hypothetical protein